MIIGQFQYSQVLIFLLRRQNNSVIYAQFSLQHLAPLLYLFHPELTPTVHDSPHHNHFHFLPSALALPLSTYGKCTVCFAIIIHLASNLLFNIGNIKAFHFHILFECDDFKNKCSQVKCFSPHSLTECSHGLRHKFPLVWLISHRQKNNIYFL